AGGVVKSADTLVKFAAKSERAERAVVDLIDRAPMPKSIRDGLLSRVIGTAVTKVPEQLEGGAKNYVVYKGVSPQGLGTYVGITNDFDRRVAEHAAAGRGFSPERISGTMALTRGEARSIEEACIAQGGLAGAGGSLENQVHSISPLLPYYDRAVAAGQVL